jgi:hypothetical protein
MQLGKLPPSFENTVPRIAHYVTGALPPPPSAIDYSSPVLQWGTFLNTPPADYNDCTIAAAAHAIQLWTANTGEQLTLSDGDVTAAYQKFAGSDFKKALKVQDVLGYWYSHGIGDHQIQAYGQLEPQNQIQVEDCIDLLGVCYIGLGLPAFITKRPSESLPGIWQLQPYGPTGDGTPTHDDGHAIVAFGYDVRFLNFVSWGRKYQMTWQFYNTYMDEAYGIASQDWIVQKTGMSPSGFDLDSLRHDLKIIVG